MAEWAPKRFWQAASTQAVEDGFGVTLDGRPVRTPAKQPLVVPSLPLAQIIAAEWDAQDQTIRPETMPFTRSANSAIDRVAPQRSEVVDIIAAYVDADLLCYRAPQPQALFERQAAEWDPLLAWSAATLGAHLVPRVGVMHAPQSPETLGVLRDHVRGLDPFVLTALHDLVALSGSLVLGFAVLRAYLPPDEAWRLSRIDEDWQIALWGADEEAIEITARKKTDFLHAAQFYDSCMK